jgi:crossover junction endodeoxyribonuclease RuvC
MLLPAFAALLGITLGTLYQKRFCPHFDLRTGSVIQFLPTAVLTALVAWTSESMHIEWTPQFAFALLWLVLVLSFGAISLLNVLIRSGSAVNVASLFYLTPPSTAVIAWLVFGETLGGLALAGMVLAVGGVYLARGAKPMSAAAKDPCCASSASTRVCASPASAVIEKTGNRLAYLASGCIRTDAGFAAGRLGTIYAGLRELVASTDPDQAAVEIVFVNVNPQSTLLLGQARGAAITALVASGLEVAEYTALQVKQAVVGNGHADKVQVQHMVRRLLSLSATQARRCRCAGLCHRARARRAGAWATGQQRSARTQRPCLSEKEGEQAMIGRLTGILLEKNPPQVVLDVHGVGLRARRADEHFLQPAGNGEKISLLTHFVVREDGHFLYGFASEGRALRLSPVAENLGRRRAPGAVGALRAVGERSGAGGGAAGGRPPDQGPRHRHQDRRTPAARTQGEARRRAAGKRRACREPRTMTFSMRCWRWVTMTAKRPRR